jgi:hypothetical protein
VTYAHASPPLPSLLVICCVAPLPSLCEVRQISWRPWRTGQRCTLCSPQQSVPWTLGLALQWWSLRSGLPRCKFRSFLQERWGSLLQLVVASTRWVRALAVKKWVGCRWPACEDCCLCVVWCRCKGVCEGMTGYNSPYPALHPVQITAGSSGGSLVFFAPSSWHHLFAIVLGGCMVWVSVSGLACLVGAGGCTAVCRPLPPPPPSPHISLCGVRLALPSRELADEGVRTSAMEQAAHE